MEKVRGVAGSCDRYGVTLVAAAMQFPLYHPAVNCVIPGANHPDQVVANLAHFKVDIPDVLWRDLKQQGYLQPDAVTPA